MVLWIMTPCNLVDWAAMLQMNMLASFSGLKCAGSIKRLQYSIIKCTHMRGPRVNAG